MSIFGSIMSRILGRDATAAPTPAADDTKRAAPTVAPADAVPQTPPSTDSPTGATAAPAGAAPAAPVDVSAVLTEMASKSPQELDWKRSIVDLMKLLGLDSSLKARQELAKELNYGGDTKDSAAMNIWLHKQVMAKLAENGGRVPDELRS
jgi:hypothetical protein